MKKKTTKLNPVLQYRIVRTDISYGERTEGAYETALEAEVRIGELRSAAVQAQRAAEFRKSVGKPRYTDDWDIQATAHFDERKYAVASEPLSSCIYRLNTLPQESSALVREIMFKLRHYDCVTLCWTCMGHTRAEWQGEAAASWLRSHGFIATACANGDVAISLGKEVR